MSVRVWSFSAGGIDASQRLMHGHGTWDGGHRVSLTCVLVERPEGLVLIDTGWGSPTVRDPRDYPGRFFRATTGAPVVTDDTTALGHVRALGFAAEDVTDVVLTHLDIDHVGGLVDFPGARVHVGRAEHAATLARRPLRRVLHDNRKALAHGPRYVVADLVDHADLGFPRSADLFGDGSVTLLDAAGHTRGHCAVAVRAEGRTLIHAGDAFVDARELDGEAGLPLGVRLYRRILHEDRPAAGRVLDHLRALHAEGRATLVNAHDAGLLARLPRFPAPFAGPA
jgi:glyoxylase-like metal-dependent hydrolase (beta-lactamase superfamily II)